MGASKVIEDPDPGLLAFRDKEGADPDNLTCTGGKKMKITINVEDYTYTIKEDLPEHMYINGSPYSLGWDWAVAPEMVPVTQTPGMFWSIQYYTEETKSSLLRLENGKETLVMTKKSYLRKQLISPN